MGEHQDTLSVAFGLPSHGRDGVCRLLVEAIHDYAIVMLDPAGVVASWNPGAERLTGYPAAEMIGRPISFLDATDAANARTADDLLEAARIQGGDQDESPRRRKDGSAFVARTVVTAIRDDAGAEYGFAIVMHEVADRGLDHATSDRLNAELAAKSRDLEQARDALDINYRDLAEKAQQLAEANEQLMHEAEERKRTEEQLRRVQRLEAIGQLTGGIAHDFNNLLTSVLGNLDLARRVALPDEARRLMDNAIRSAERGARLTSHLLAFGRKQMLSVRAVDLNEMVTSLKEMLSRTLTSAIVIEMELAADLWPAFADTSKLELALINLAINARDAMPTGGTLTIGTRNVPPGDRARPDDLGPEAGDFVALVVSDTGTGMTEEVRQRAFEPFFTTKGVGQGSGLGLSMVYGLAKQLGGTVRIETEIGRGTALFVFLPRANGVKPSVQEFGAPGPALQQRSGHILLVDDDALVRETVSMTLRRLGYVVSETESGDAALVLLDRVDDFALMISDVVMPGIRGVSLAAEARRRRPGLPILLITGHPGETSESEFAQHAFPVLRKPFRPADLDAMVLACLPRQTREDGGE